MDEIRNWQKDRDLFGLRAKEVQTLARYKIKEDPRNFFDYLLYDFFNIENREAAGSRRYTNAEAMEIMKLRYLLLENNWSFIQGQAVLIAQPVNEQFKAVITEQNLKFRGLVFAPSYRRRYSEDAKYFCHVLGYVGNISAPEYENYNKYGYSVQDEVGKAGIELSCERYLHGTPGVISLGTWVKGDGEEEYYLDATSRIEPIPGKTVRLTIDTPAQIAAYEALRDNIKSQRVKDVSKGNGGAAVALNPQTGAVISMVSVPVYDPRDFAAASYDDAARERVERYLRDKDEKALLNRAIGEIYAPGSTFKAITSIAALMEGVIGPGNQHYECKGIDTVGYREWSATTTVFPASVTSRPRSSTPATCIFTRWGSTRASRTSRSGRRSSASANTAASTCRGKSRGSAPPGSSSSSPGTCRRTRSGIPRIPVRPRSVSSTTPSPWCRWPARSAGSRPANS